MIIDVTRKLLSYTGEPISIAPGKPDATLRYCCCEALMAPHAEDASLSGEEKVRRFGLAQAIYTTAAPDLSHEDATLLRKLISRHFGTLVVGAAWPLFEAGQRMAEAK